MPVRVYTPSDAIGGNAPLLIWIHGGGWVIGDLDTADAVARALANRSGAVTVSVDYRRAPEHSPVRSIEHCLAPLLVRRVRPAKCSASLDPPTRHLDTRTGTGLRRTALGANSTFNLRVARYDGVPG